MTRAEIIRLRLAAQRISGASLARPRPADVVATLGAVQAQDYLGALWAVGLRARGTSEQDVERALAVGEIVRTWPMRGTLHFVAAADARWMTELLAARPAAAAAGRLRSYGIDEEVLKRALAARPGEEALGELAHRYFAGHGPATLADLAWWSGLKVADARLAVAVAGRRIEERKVVGESMWLSRSSRATAAPARGAYILPAFDELLVGYADRSAAVDPAHAHAWNDGGGLLRPTVVVRGRVVGTWKRRIEGRELVFSPALRVPLGPSDAGAVERAVSRYARFLGLEARSDSPSRLR